MSLAIFIRWATREIKAIWQRIEKIDVQQRILPSRKYRILIVGGNTLEEGSAGINYEANVPSVPSAYDPDVTSSFIDGVGRGTLYVDGVARDGYVLVLCSDAGTFRNALVAGDVVVSGGPIRLPVDGGGSVQIYTAG